MNNKKFIKYIDGFEKMGSALDIDIYSDMFMPYFFFRCDSSDLSVCSLEEYSKGMTFFKRKTFKELKNDYLAVKEKLLKIEFTPKERSNRYYYNNYEEEKDDFKKFYLWLFEFNNMNKKDKKDKKVSFQVAKFYWSNLFCSYNFIKNLLDYLENEKKLEYIKHDQWNCLLELIRHSKNNYPKDYSLDDSWPTLFDDFYIYYCKKNGIEYKLPEENLGQFNYMD